MERYVSLEEISDGRLYDVQDMVKADCNGCKGCSACCQGMGDTIILDPFDCYRLTEGCQRSFEELLYDKLELQVDKGIILPNIKMAGENEHCIFLNAEGRCSIHAFRPGMCRLFPLGRYYEEHGFRYFLQIHECQYPNKTKVKVRKWIDTPDYKRNEQFIIDWHYFIKEVQQKLSDLQDKDGREELSRQIPMYIVKSFYSKAYDKNKDFYGQFYERLTKARDLLHNPSD